ncbi:D-alanyl-D-alanine dipeptidase [Jannaschia seosinensis]|uniref:D-alanyl-D-alanine dipeptidase n=1 Tax=Jannaschia seosinensis TaxID=313367 RepID=A0A0M7B8N7_9RHOB|nr:M15 family metallopeptidase [Jannaschia seosinensis]CUH15758.1 D-alanyl-D-alanine dipeptidase [Jannaschia seosinensis]
MTQPLSLTEGPLAAIRDRPLLDPVADAAMRRTGYRSHPVDLSDPRGGDPMTDLRDCGIAGANAYHVGLPPYHAPVTGAVPDLLLRAPLAERLAGVNARLAPYALELWVFDAWRPVAVQNYFHDRWMPARLRALHPDWSEDRIATETERYWARGARGVIDPASPPPHATGAALDLTIRRRDGAELFMGTIFDDVSEASNTAAFEAEPDGLAFSAREARANRRLLYWLMAEAGFANNPTEWWHFSRGDQMWARITGAAAAFYSVPPNAPDQSAGR